MHMRMLLLNPRFILSTTQHLFRGFRGARQIFLQALNFPRYSRKIKKPHLSMRLNRTFSFGFHLLRFEVSLYNPS